MNMKMRFFLISGVCIGLVLKIFVFDIARVHGSSMEPAVHENSLVFIASVRLIATYTMGTA